MDNIQEKIQSVQKLYDEWERQIQNFKKETQLNCLSNCGKCCKQFEPYISLLDAIVVIDYIKKNEELWTQYLHYKHNNSQPICPFYHEDREYRCGIYYKRPTICRLFSYSCNQNGQYAPCSQIQSIYKQQIQKGMDLVQQGFLLPSLPNAFKQLCNIDEELAQSLHPFTKSLELVLPLFQGENSLHIRNNFIIS